MKIITIAGIALLFGASPGFACDLMSKVAFNASAMGYSHRNPSNVNGVGRSVVLTNRWCLENDDCYRHALKTAKKYCSSFKKTDVVR